MATTLPHQLDRPAGAADTCDGQLCGWRRGNPPACPSGRGFAERVLVATASAPQNQHGQVRVCRSELEPPRGDHGDLADLADHGRWRTIADCVLDNGQERGVVTGVRVDHVGCREPRLRQPRRIEVRPATGPEDRAAKLAGLPRSDAGDEQCSRGIVRQGSTARRDFVKRGRTKPAAQAVVNIRDPERHDAVVRHNRGRCRLELGEGGDTRYGSDGHGGLDSARSPYVPLMDEIGQPAPTASGPGDHSDDRGFWREQTCYGTETNREDFSFVLVSGDS